MKILLSYYKINNFNVRNLAQKYQRILDKDKIYSSSSFFNANRAKLTGLKS